MGGRQNRETGEEIQEAYGQDNKYQTNLGINRKKRPLHSNIVYDAATVLKLDGGGAFAMRAGAFFFAAAAAAAALSASIFAARSAALLLVLGAIIGAIMALLGRGGGTRALVPSPSLVDVPKTELDLGAAGVFALDAGAGPEACEAGLVGWRVGVLFKEPEVALERVGLATAPPLTDKSSSES